MGEYDDAMYITELREEIKGFFATVEKLETYLKMANERGDVFYKHVKKRGHIIQTLQRKLQAHRGQAVEIKELVEHCGRLQTDVDHLEKQVDEGWNKINTPCGDALDKLWKAIMPDDYGDWEYAGQAYRHLLCVYREQETKIKELEKELQSEYEDQAGIDI